MKELKILFSVLLVFYSSLLFNACSTGSIMDTPDLYKDQVTAWRNRAVKDSKDTEAVKNLAVFYIQSRLFEVAEYYVNRGLELLPNDPSLNFYKGLQLEFLNKPGEAIQYYVKYTSVNESSPFRDLMEGRYLWLMRQQAFADVSMLIKNEEKLSFTPASDSSIAVFPLIYQGVKQEYIPLSRGFSEMISNDLAKVKRLTVLERIRIQAIIDELKLSQSGLIDQSTAPRMGKLLKARVIVSGDYDIASDGKMKLDLGSWDAETSTRKSWINKNGSLNDIFILQKEIVFDFLKSNNIEITQSEKDAISYIPTKSMESFLSYSKGLLQEDEGDYNGAKASFKRATEIDPNFKPAGDKFKSSQILSNGGGPKENMLTTLRNEMPVVQNEFIQIVEDRTRSLSDKISSNFMPGVDSRSPAQEGSGKASTELPPPPPPPPSIK